MSRDRFDISSGAPTMNAVVTTGNGGYDKLVYRDVPVPVPGPGEMRIKVLAAGVNNTEINTRLGWYSSSVTTSTDTAPRDAEADARARDDCGWDKPTPFPLIQGTDCCGRVVEEHDAADGHLVGKRVLVRACMRPHSFNSLDNIWMASDFDGAFAESRTILQIVKKWRNS